MIRIHYSNHSASSASLLIICGGGFRGFILEDGVEIIIGLHYYRFYLFGIGNNIMSDDPPTKRRSKAQREWQKEKEHLEKGVVSLPGGDLAEGGEEELEKIGVYLRSASKKAVKIQVPGKVALAEIKQAVEERLGIERQKQLLHLNGKNITDYAHIQLVSTSIIHVAHRDHLLKPGETVKVKVIIINAFSGKGPQQKTYSIKSNEEVGELISRIEEEVSGQFKRGGLVYFCSLLQSSRLLDRQRSFYQQDIAENAELICLITKNQLKTRFCNDTREDIIDDISALLELDTKSQEKLVKQKPAAVSQDFAVEVDNERQQLFEEADYKRSRRESLSEEQQYSQEEQQSQNKLENALSFKKNGRQRFSGPDEREKPLLRKIKARKPKSVLDQMLKTIGKDNIFYREDAIEEKKEEIAAIANQPAQQDVAVHKPVACIPQAMPVEQRRKIKLQMQKLFDFDSSQIAPSCKPPSPSPSPEEQKPKSPPTEEPPRIQKRKQKMENLRFSMGSRPAFLNNLNLAFKNAKN